VLYIRTRKPSPTTFFLIILLLTSRDLNSNFNIEETMGWGRIIEVYFFWENEV